MCTKIALPWHWAVLVALLFDDELVQGVEILLLALVYLEAAGNIHRVRNACPPMCIKNNTQMRARVAKYTLKENSCSVSWGVAWSRSLCRNSLMLSTATPKGRRYSWGNLCLAESESSIRPTRITCATTTMSRFRSELPRSCVTHNPTNHPAILLKIARRFLCGHTRG